jgi:integral membrane protein
MDTAFLNKLRLLGAIEGVSTLVLFGVAMPLKYFYGMPLAVSIAGSLHGALFVGLVIMNTIAVQRVPIGPKLCVAGVMGAVIPFGPFVVDHWLKRLPEAARLERDEA